ncbi:nuclear transport factor 2 family protein [Aequorivita sp. KMM 9714]|uniref:nuclear transport factor 2 family protein n=1 Tax=Aequorivita sp. KMM 9714 TaxID=2707173 RepID=UPI0013ED3D31|nr:nuclear transport factor 2 family protein [Aequorivita sp. KMM 9714]NGX83565.1 nuclear transport factor 2 family protein [Aequorivita sp. KMM 9714]
MKTKILIVMMLISFITTAQKKNGTIYIDHPAITVVEDMTKSFVNGDTDKVSSYLAEDFMAYNGNNINPNDKGTDKESFSSSAKNWNDALDYFSISRSPGAYPDALEYKDDNQKNVVWVQTWEDMKGVHKKTGVKVNQPIHRLFIVNKNNKIQTIITYNNNNIFREVGQSNSNRTNGTIYNHHEYINTVRNLMYAFENKDFDKAYGFYDDNARFVNSSSPDFESISLAEQKEIDKKLFEKYDIKDVQIVGYPDYLHYEMGDAHVVQSWWNINLMRKSDKKAITVPIHYQMYFNEDGKITRETAYYNPKLMD